MTLFGERLFVFELTFPLKLNIIIFVFRSSGKIVKIYLINFVINFAY